MMNNINKFFDDVQNYIQIKINDDIKDIIRYLKQDNIQAIVNKSYYEGYSVMELGDKLLKMYNSNNPNINNNFDELSGERVLNKMENKLLRFKDFQKIYEFKSRGNLYHLIDFKKLKFILKTNTLKSYKFNNISTTRNKMMNSYIGDNFTTVFKLELDGDKLSQNYKIRPFRYETNIIGLGTIKKGYLDEEEETILTNKIKNISSYVKKIIIIKDKIERMKNTDWFTDNLKESFPEFLNKHIKQINKLFGDIYFQEGSKIFKDDEYLNSLLNFKIKHINHAYDLNIRYLKKKTNDRLGGYTEYFDSLTSDFSTENVVIGYTYNNLKLYKQFSEKDIKEITKNIETIDDNTINRKTIYLSDFEFDNKDIVKKTDNYFIVKKAKLVDIKIIK